MAQLLKSPLGSSTSYLIDEVMGKDGIGHLLGDVKLSRTGRGVVVKGSIKANTNNTCNRCLKITSHTINFDVEDEFLPESYVFSDRAKTEELDVAAIIHNDNILDLSEVLRQYALLSVPIKPLCNPNCAGLCAICGQNLNESPCICSTQTNSGSVVDVHAASQVIERRTLSNGTTAKKKIS